MIFIFDVKSQFIGEMTDFDSEKKNWEVFDFEGKKWWFGNVPEFLVEFGIQIVVNDTGAHQPSFAQVNIHVGVGHIAFVDQFGDPS